MEKSISTQEWIFVLHLKSEVQKCFIIFGMGTLLTKYTLLPDE